MDKPRPSIPVAVRVLGYAVLAVVTVLGFWAILTTLREGHMGAATTQFVPWGIWISAYIYLLGLSGGVFFSPPWSTCSG